MLGVYLPAADYIKRCHATATHKATICLRMRMCRTAIQYCHLKSSLLQLTCSFVHPHRKAEPFNNAACSCQSNTRTLPSIHAFIDPAPSMAYQNLRGLCATVTGRPLLYAMQRHRLHHTICSLEPKFNQNLEPNLEM